jgi:hypothetical protein
MVGCFTDCPNTGDCGCAGGFTSKVTSDTSLCPTPTPTPEPTPTPYCEPPYGGWPPGACPPPGCPSSVCSWVCAPNGSGGHFCRNLGVSTDGAYHTQADCERDRANGGCGPTPTPTPRPTPTPTRCIPECLPGGCGLLDGCGGFCACPAGYYCENYTCLPFPTPTYMTMVSKKSAMLKKYGIK